MPWSSPVVMAVWIHLGSGGAHLLSPKTRTGQVWTSRRRGGCDLWLSTGICRSHWGTLALNGSQPMEQIVLTRSTAGSRIPQVNTNQQTQNICKTCIQCWTNVEDVGPTSYTCYTNVLCLLGDKRLNNNNSPTLPIWNCITLCLSYYSLFIN